MSHGVTSHISSLSAPFVLLCTFGTEPPDGTRENLPVRLDAQLPQPELEESTLLAGTCWVNIALLVCQTCPDDPCKQTLITFTSEKKQQT